MSAQYDSSVLVAFADDLYQKAALVVAQTTVLWGIAGCFAAGGAFVFTRGQIDKGWLWALALIGFVLGYMVGSRRAFQYRLEAQRTLCQVAIERNTRRETEKTPEPSPGGTP